LWSQEFDAELINEQIEVTASPGRLVKNCTYEIRINNKAGEEYTDVSIHFTKQNKIHRIDASIKDQSGIIIKKLKSSEITERSDFSHSFYSDYLVKEFTLKHNVYPYILTYSYQIQYDEFLSIEYWNPVLDIKVPTVDATLILNIPYDYAISYSNRNVEEPLIEKGENSLIYRWKTSYNGALREETLAPPLINFLPVVEIVPKNFRYILDGSFESWSSYGYWEHSLIAGLDIMPENEKARIISLTGNINDDREKIRVLYHHLQDETRYINVNIETGGMKPYPASYVVDNRYGDCKALTNYFKAVLEVAGIKAYYTNVLAEDPLQEIDLTFPSQQFNHVILFVPLDGDTVWLDCTSNRAFNYLGSFTQNHDVFVIDGKNSFFLRTPRLCNMDVIDSRNISVNYSGSASATFRNHYKGEMYENLFDLNHSFKESDKDYVVRKYIVEKGFDLSRYEILENNRDSNEIVVVYEASSPNLYKNYGNEMVINNIKFDLPAFEKPQYRKLPVQIDYPIYKSDTIEYDLINGFRMVNESENLNISASYGEYKFKMNIDGDNIRVVKSILINPGTYPLQEYIDFYKFIKEVNDSENRSHIILTK